MLILGVMGASRANNIIDSINLANPLTIANQLMADDLSLNKPTVLLIIFLFIASSFGLIKYLKINPVWSRY
jgi:ABC-2 type transport system permease protein